LPNFKGRDQQLIEPHRKMMGDGQVDVKTAGLHGAGGIGKTQLAVEYTHPYRYQYTSGMYWLNTNAGWCKEVADYMVNIARSLIEKPTSKKRCPSATIWRHRARMTTLKETHPKNNLHQI
jgi:hypothetical protein